MIFYGIIFTFVATILLYLIDKKIYLSDKLQLSNFIFSILIIFLIFFVLLAIFDFCPGIYIYSEKASKHYFDKITYISFF